MLFISGTRLAAPSRIKQQFLHHLPRRLALIATSYSSMDQPLSDPSNTYLPVYTRILKVNPEEIGSFDFTVPNSYLKPWTITLSRSASATNLLDAADALLTTQYPVAFPTETVYGLGANAQSSSAVQGIFKAKQRPSDNPLIVHVSSLEMLRRLLDPLGTHEMAGTDPIPSIYNELISRFWPGPLSILLPNTEGSRIAPEVTAGQPTFAARMPSNPLALALIQLSHLPLAAPSANASTKPSPTTAEHVAHDLAGRIEIILDGGPCTVGVESTVVDGLSSPPAILRPGGIGIDEIRQVPGWEDVVVGYKDAAFENGSTETPRAPGMKYKHYSPAARVVLADPGVRWTAIWERIQQNVSSDPDGPRKIGIIRTKVWPDIDEERSVQSNGTSKDVDQSPVVKSINGKNVEFFSMHIGPSTAAVARGLFSALRGLDLAGVQTIYVEGISDGERSNGTATGVGDGQTAAAVMNRLRKAASERITAE